MEKYQKFQLEATYNRMWTLTGIHMVLNNNYLEAKKNISLKKEGNKTFKIFKINYTQIFPSK